MTPADLSFIVPAAIRPSDVAAIVIGVVIGAYLIYVLVTAEKL